MVDVANLQIRGIESHKYMFIKGQYLLKML